MGGANNICSDKTGTLTLNKMTLAQVWAGRQMEIDTYSSEVSLSEISPSSEWI